MNLKDEIRQGETGGQADPVNMAVEPQTSSPSPSEMRLMMGTLQPQYTGVNESSCSGSHSLSRHRGRVRVRSLSGECAVAAICLALALTLSEPQDVAKAPDETAEHGKGIELGRVWEQKDW